MANEVLTSTNDWYDQIVKNNIEMDEWLKSDPVAIPQVLAHNSSSILTSSNVMDIEYKSELEYLVKEVDAIKSQNSRLLSDISKVQHNLIESNKQIADNLDYIYFLETEVSRLDQYGRRENVEFTSIPESIPDEKLENSIIEILHKIGLTHIEHYSIAACHRLATKDRFGNRNTIVRFVNRKDAISCLQNRKKLSLCRDIGYRNLFMVENLCPSYRSIFESLSELKKRNKIKRLWSYNGTINFKFSDSTNEKPKKDIS